MANILQGSHSSVTVEFKDLFKDLLQQLGVWESDISFPSGVRGGAGQN